MVLLAPDISLSFTEFYPQSSSKVPRWRLPKPIYSFTVIQLNVCVSQKPPEKDMRGAKNRKSWTKLTRLVWRLFH